MSSSFLGAFNKAKEATKNLVNNASNSISAKLQMNLTASPPGSPNSIKSSRTNVLRKDSTSSENTNSQFVSKVFQVSTTPPSNVSSIKYSEPSPSKSISDNQFNNSKPIVCSENNSSISDNLVHCSLQLLSELNNHVSISSNDHHTLKDTVFNDIKILIANTKNNNEVVGIICSYLKEFENAHNISPSSLLLFLSTDNDVQLNMSPNDNVIDSVTTSNILNSSNSFSNLQCFNSSKILTSSPAEDLQISEMVTNSNCSSYSLDSSLYNTSNLNNNSPKTLVDINTNTSCVESPLSCSKMQNSVSETENIALNNSKTGSNSSVSKAFNPNLENHISENSISVDNSIGKPVSEEKFQNVNSSEIIFVTDSISQKSHPCRNPTIKYKSEDDEVKNLNIIEKALPTENVSPKLNNPPQIDPNSYCIFCLDRTHSSHVCTKFSDSKQFWSVIYDDRRCKNCFRQFHMSHRCYDFSFCLHRNCRRRDKHSPILCKHRYETFGFQKPHENNYLYKDTFKFSGSLQCYNRFSNKLISQNTCSESSLKKFSSKESQTENKKVHSVEVQTDNYESHSVGIQTSLEIVTSNLGINNSHVGETAAAMSPPIVTRSHSHTVSCSSNYFVSNLPICSVTSSCSTKMSVCSQPALFSPEVQGLKSDVNFLTNSPMENCNNFQQFVFDPSLFGNLKLEELNFIHSSIVKSRYQIPFPDESQNLELLTSL